MRGRYGIGHTQSPVALAISSPTFFGDRPSGPILGASADEAPISPPVARRWMTFSSLGSNLGAEGRKCVSVGVLILLQPAPRGSGEAAAAKRSRGRYLPMASG